MNDATRAAGGGEQRAGARRGSLAVLYLLIILGVVFGVGWGWQAFLLWELRGAGGVEAVRLPASARIEGVFLGTLLGLAPWAGVAALAAGVRFLRTGARHVPPRWLEPLPGMLLAAGMVVALAAVAIMDPQVRTDRTRLEIIASGLLAGAALLTALQVFWTLAGRPQGWEIGHLFVVAAVEWLLLWATADVVLRVRHMGKTFVPAGLREVIFEVAVLGLFANALFAMGVRFLPGLLGVGSVRVRSWVVTLIAWNAGLVALLVGPWWVGVAAAGVMAFGAAFYVVGMSGFGGVRTKIIAENALGGAHGRGMLWAGVVWLGVGLALVAGWLITRGGPPESGYDAVNLAIRHVLVAGFGGSTALGLAFALAGFFLPRRLMPVPVMRAAGAGWTVGTLVRTVGGLATAVPEGWGYELMFWGAVVQTLAIAAASVVVIRAAAAGRGRGGELEAV